MVVPFHIYERKDLLRNNINTLSRDTFHYQNVAISLKVKIEYKNFFTSMSLHNCIKLVFIDVYRYKRLLFMQSTHKSSYKMSYFKDLILIKTCGFMYLL